MKSPWIDHMSFRASAPPFVSVDWNSSRSPWSSPLRFSLPKGCSRPWVLGIRALRLGCRLANVWHSECREVQIYGSERGRVTLMIDAVWPSPTVARSRHRCTCRTNLLPVPPASLTDPWRTRSRMMTVLFQAYTSNSASLSPHSNRSRWRSCRCLLKNRRRCKNKGQWATSDSRNRVCWRCNGASSPGQRGRRPAFQASSACTDRLLKTCVDAG